MFMTIKAATYEPCNSPSSKSQYTLTELLAASDYSKVDPTEDSDWVPSEGVGEELI